jgi:hypothetical protein
MAQAELALQKLNDLRDVVEDDGEIAELVDTLATLMVLKQDMTNPMYGAKVTYYEKPDGEFREIPWEEFRDLAPMELADDPEEADQQLDGREWHNKKPWYLRWLRRTDDDGDPYHITQRYHKWTGKEELPEDEVPDEILGADGVGAMQEVADDRDMEEWMIYKMSDGPEFRVNRLVPCTELKPRRAIVVEPHVADQPSGTDFWDPNRGEYTTPDDYPMGTVNLVVPEDGDSFVEDYTYKMNVETSVTPAHGEPVPNEYTPGWEDPGNE